jgi:NAD(P)-dependent dehydrogenase (short-subunit alcohol dehydrogenase family)
MGTIAITGAAGGIGLATRRRLEADGHEIIGIDLRDTEVHADLGTTGGRRAMAREVDELCGGALDGLVVAAGIQNDDGAAVVSVNFFGAVAALTSLRPLLEHGQEVSVVVIGSNSATTHPGYPLEIAEWCLSDNETQARQAATAHPDATGAYAASKLALALWCRRAAPSDEWMANGIRLNVIAPGFIDTPLTEGGWDFVSSLGEVYPMPARRPGTAEEVAKLITYLLSTDAAYFCGSVITMDGGTEAALRPDAWPRPVGH